MKPGYARKVNFLHRLESRTKLLLTVLFTILVFLVDSLLVAACNMFAFILLFICIKIPVKKMFAHYKYILFFAMLVIFLQMLFGPETAGSRYLLKPVVPQFIPLLGGLGSLKLDGLFTGLMITCRIVTLGILIRVLTLSTETQHLAYGITRLGLSYKAAHIITSAFNLIPSFGEEAGLIIDARRLRGVKVRKNMNIFNMLSEYSTLALPLIMKAMRRAVSIGLIMDARAFGAYKYRTWLLETRMTAIDFSAITVGAAYTAVMVFLNHIF